MGRDTISFDEVGEMLDEIAEEIPQDFYRELNGGIVLLQETKRHRDFDRNRAGGLFVLGEYHNDRKGMGGMGRYIAIYYGSFIRLYAHLSADEQRGELRRVLIHEFTHHIESLAGERGLEIKDAIELEKYRQRFLDK
jgi:predicted Zn-dependent protease with MMP-like domain